MLNNIRLLEGKYLDQVIKNLPSRKIIYKYETGCGATHLELFISKRHSIVIEPYIPVILGKSNKDVFAVHGDITTDDIIEYLSQSRKYHKLVSTPEGLRKIKDACDDLEINMYTMFFLLVDECEKLIQDVRFRQGIIEVMDYFFDFNKSSFISATPIPPSDPRFREQGFEDFIIHPAVYKKKKIDVYSTNNLASTIKNYFQHNKADHYVIFINSTERIASIINFLNIHDESQVYCAEPSVDSLKLGEKTISAHELWDFNLFKKYNFFTSRFFTAFDMELPFTPNVLIISDVKKAAHSALDPETDIIQIAGRARNGINHLAHITNWEAALESKTAVEIDAYLDGSHQAFLTIKELRDTTDNCNAKKVFAEAMTMIDYSKFINKRTEQKCYFMRDNEVYCHKIRGYYKSPQNLINAYNSTGRFKVRHISENYNLGDENLEFLKPGLSPRKLVQFVTEAFHEHFTKREEYPFTIENNHAFNKLARNHQLTYRWYRELGIGKIRELHYNPTRIEAAYTTSKIKNSESYLKLSLNLNAIFKEGRLFSTSKIQKILSFLFRRYNVILPTTVTQLKQWFTIVRTTVGYQSDGREIKEWRITGKTNLIQLPQSFRQ